MFRRNRLFKRIHLHILPFLLFIISFNNESVSAAIPRPDHVVVCILENHSYAQLIGNSSAPYINQLLLKSANMMEYFALTHPSQPNYLMLFSGSNQGETTDNLPVGCPWTTPNLGASLINAGYTFGAYSEGLPSTGSTVATSGAYARKHCPWVNWQGIGPNQIPAACSMSMTEWPTDFSTLPTVSFVIPDQNNDMHNGTDPAKIAVGDLWLQQKLGDYIVWAEQNNSLFILTLDEDNFTTTNKIMCLFIGPMVRQGNYYLKGYSHYDLLHTIEEMFGLPNAGNSIHSQSISEIWMTPTTHVTNIHEEINSSYVYPNPITANSMISINNDGKSNNSEFHIRIYDIAGRMVDDEIISMLPGRNNYAFRKNELTAGVYTFIIRSENEIKGSGKFIVSD
jgi:hypothetical protein